MLATGGSAVIMKKMGEQKSKEAKEDFSFLILVNVLVGIVMCALGYLLMNCIFAGMNLSPCGVSEQISVVYRADPPDE